MFKTDNNYLDYICIECDNIETLIKTINDFKQNTNYEIKYNIDKNKYNIIIYYNDKFFTILRNKFY